jgi:hypothetical protein
MVAGAACASDQATQEGIMRIAAAAIDKAIEQIPESGASTDSLYADPPTLTFGLVQPGRSLLRAITVKNRIDKPLAITAASLTGPGFQFEKAFEARTLAPGEAIDLWIRFSPQTARGYSGTLTFVFGGGGPKQIVNISGRGTK